MKSSKTSKKPLVSVILPAYNGLPYLEKAIHSVLKQTFTRFELLILDDASTDNSWELIKKYATKDKRIRIFRNKKNLGIGKALNLLIEKTSAQFLARMDADDVMSEKRLEKQINYLRKHPEIVVLGSFMKEIDKKGKVIGKRMMPVGHNDIYQMMYYATGIQNPTVIFNRKLIPQNFSWYQEAGLIEDLDMFFRLFKYGRFANLPEFLMFYRIHGENLSLKKVKKTFKAAQKIRKKAIREYGYKPNTKARLLHFIESLLISLTPAKYVLKLYSVFRRLSAFSK